MCCGFYGVCVCQACLLLLCLAHHFFFLLHTDLLVLFLESVQMHAIINHACILIALIPCLSLFCSYMPIGLLVFTRLLLCSDIPSVLWSFICLHRQKANSSNVSIWLVCTLSRVWVTATLLEVHARNAFYILMLFVMLFLSPNVVASLLTLLHPLYIKKYDAWTCLLHSTAFLLLSRETLFTTCWRSTATETAS